MEKTLIQLLRVLLRLHGDVEATLVNVQLVKKVIELDWVNVPVEPCAYCLVVLNPKEALKDAGTVTPLHGYQVDKPKAQICQRKVAAAKPRKDKVEQRSGQADNHAIKPRATLTDNANAFQVHPEALGAYAKRTCGQIVPAFMDEHSGSQGQQRQK